MPTHTRFSIRIDKKLLKMAQDKCKNDYDISLAPLMKIFLKSFITQKGVGFYIGDDDLCKLFGKWLTKKKSEKNRKGCTPLPGPRLSDLYDL